MDTPKTSREKILDAARILIARSETNEIRLREVGELAGVSMGSITHHFASKSVLLEACLDEYYERIAELGSKLAALATEPMTLEQLVRRCSPRVSLLRERARSAATSSGNESG